VDWTVQFTVKSIKRKKKLKADGISLFTVDWTVQLTVKSIKRKKKLKASAFSPWTAYNIKR
jgi:hypothetical protein